MAEPSATWRAAFDRGMACGGASDFARAEACFREAVSLAPEEPYPHYELGYTLFLLGRYAEALDEFRRTDALSRGFFLVQTEAYLCERVISGSVGPAALSVLRHLQHLTDSGAAQGEEAVAAAEHAVALAPDCALAHFYLGKALLGPSRAAAEQSLRRCLELGPDDTTAIDARFHLGVLRQEAGEEDEARRVWREIVADYPGNPHTRFAELMAGPA